MRVVVEMVSIFDSVKVGETLRKTYRHRESGTGHHSAVILQKLPAHRYCIGGGGGLVLVGGGGGCDAFAC